eukprot:CAMPEP_0185770804 /NCGR_PEP_ID=MMETSP1174-20130828/61273_1 /TAXON_ID=35687 /ORGANISM="Dictyocha speculum, Strain CCMP1381" /LENGTH=107 /DNA_ID=CAMNT_0028456397 /DNA_START=99 /DNA_END=420 /DNA_ORIENTATION=+
MRKMNVTAHNEARLYMIHELGKFLAPFAAVHIPLHRPMANEDVCVLRNLCKYGLGDVMGQKKFVPQILTTGMSLPAAALPVDSCALFAPCFVAQLILCCSSSTLPSR